MLKVILVGILACSVKTYPATFVVTDVSYETNVVSMVNFNGEEYEFFEVEDWNKGDIVSAVMSNNGTPDDVKDDIIISKRYSGYLK